MRVRGPHPDTRALRQRHGHPALLDAAGGHPFIRYDVPPELTVVWWEVDGAVAFRRRRRSGHVFAFLGTDTGFAEPASCPRW